MGTKEVATEVLARCLAGDVPAALPPELLEDSAASALFGILAEGLSDRFDPALCDAYANLFAPAIGPHLEARYQRVRAPVLSRPRLIPRPSTFSPASPSAPTSP